jgi:uroporphyrinogen decarboxylase
MLKGCNIFMTSRERVKKALDFEEFDNVPVEGILSEGIATDVGHPDYKYGKGKASGIEGKKGSWVDMWGCIWEAGEDGVKGEVKQALLSDWSKLDSFIPPWDSLKKADLSLVNKQCEQSSKFMYHAWGTDPFQRMQFLRGTENLFMDLAYGDLEVYKLRDMIHEFHMKEVEMWTNTEVDAIHLEDDWGTQLSLLISPKLWREFFKPLYKDYCDVAHSKGKYVIMHSDGNISAIIPDLIEIGVNAINAQLDCMDVDALSETHHGKIAFWGGFDRQYLLPFGTTDEVRREVQRIANSFFKYKRTGIIGQCYKDKGHRTENILAVYDEWSKL